MYESAHHDRLVEGEEPDRPAEETAPSREHASLALAGVVGNQAFGALIGRSGPAAPERGRAPAPAGDADIARGLAEAVSTRNPTGEEREDELMTVNGDGGVADAAPADAGTTPAANCSVKSGPTYSATGNVTVTSSGGKKKAPFTFSASFSSDSATGKAPRCCSVRQYIKWDKKFVDWYKGPPHAGFPSGAAHDTWYEDRDSADKRYGHRSGTHSDPIAGGGDEYTTGGTRDQANGDTYNGRDSPGGPTALTGQWQFQLKVIDTCNGDAEKAASPVITINW